MEADSDKVDELGGKSFKEIKPIFSSLKNLEGEQLNMNDTFKNMKFTSQNHINLKYKFELNEENISDEILEEGLSCNRSIPSVKLSQKIR